MQIVLKDDEIEISNKINHITSYGTNFDDAIHQMRQKAIKESGLPLSSVNLFLTRNFTSKKDSCIRQFKFLDH